MPKKTEKKERFAIGDTVYFRPNKYSSIGKGIVIGFKQEEPRWGEKPKMLVGVKADREAHPDTHVDQEWWLKANSKKEIQTAEEGVGFYEDQFKAQQERAQELLRAEEEKEQRRRKFVEYPSGRRAIFLAQSCNYRGFTLAPDTEVYLRLSELAAALDFFYGPVKEEHASEENTAAEVPAGVDSDRIAVG